MNGRDIFTVDINTLPQVTQSPLYIYQRSNIVCIAKDHSIIDVIATYPSINNIILKLPVQYCVDCDKLLISEEEFKRHQKITRYHFIPTRIRRVDHNGYYTPADNPYINYRDQESPLKLCGYSVSKTDGIPPDIRQAILEHIIERGILTKSDVINYLELFISTNGLRKGNEPAVQKWKDDLHFVYMHNFNVVAKAQITSIKPYRR